MTKVKPPPSKLQPVIRGHVDPAYMHMGPTTTGPSRLSGEPPARRLSGGYRMVSPGYYYLHLDLMGPATASCSP